MRKILISLLFVLSLNIFSQNKDVEKYEYTYEYFVKTFKLTEGKYKMVFETDENKNDFILEVSKDLKVKAYHTNSKIRDEEIYENGILGVIFIDDSPRNFKKETNVAINKIL